MRPRAANETIPTSSADLGLSKELELMSQKAQFFETIVDVLKNDYGVSLVKKRSGKSSRKVKSQD